MGIAADRGASRRGSESPQPAQRGHQSDSENQGKRAGPESAGRKHAGDDRQRGDDHSRGHADRHLPRLNERRRSLHVPRPYEPAELPGTGPAGRGVPQDRIRESERAEGREVPEFVNHAAGVWVKAPRRTLASGRRYRPGRIEHGREVAADCQLDGRLCGG